jgi:hypothetical protein
VGCRGGGAGQGRGCREDESSVGTRKGVANRRIGVRSVGVMNSELLPCCVARQRDDGVVWCDVR